MVATRAKLVLTGVGFFLLFCNKLLPPLWGLSPQGFSAVCIVAGMMVLLVFVDMTWPLFAGIVAYVVNGVYSLEETLAMSVGQSIFWFVVLVGLVLQAVSATGVLRRAALACVSLPVAKRNPWALIAVIYVLTLALGSVMDPTALILIVTQPVIEIFDLLGIKKGDRSAALIMVGLLTVDCWAYGITPIGHPLPLVMIESFSAYAPIDYLGYCLVGFAGGIAWIAVVLLVMRFVLNVDLEPFRNFDASKMPDSGGKVGKRAVASIALYGACVVLWLAPGVAQGFAPDVYEFFNGIGTLVPLLAVLVVMCLARVEGKPLLELSKEIPNAPWPAACVVGAALMVGSSINDPTLGITSRLGHVLSSSLGGVPAIVYVMVILGFCVLMTNFTSDMVSALVASSVSVLLIGNGSVEGINAAALCVSVSIAACTAYMTPPACAQAAILAGQGYVSPGRLFRNGCLFAVLSWGLAVGTYQLGCLVFAA